MAFLSQDQMKMGLTVGGAAVVTLGVSDFFLNRAFTATDYAENRELYRAGAQIAVGVGAYYLLRKYSRNVAVGAAIGGIVGGGLRLWQKYDMNATLARWFPERSSSGVIRASGYRAELPAGATKTVFYDEPASARVRVAK